MAEHPAVIMLFAPVGVAWQPSIANQLAHAPRK